jgi:hypothetical protein
VGPENMPTKRPSARITVELAYSWHSPEPANTRLTHFGGRKWSH